MPQTKASNFASPRLQVIYYVKLQKYYAILTIQDVLAFELQLKYYLEGRVKQTLPTWAQTKPCAEQGTKLSICNLQIQNNLL